MSRELFSTGSVYEPMIGCSRAVRSGNLLHHPPRERVHPGGRLREPRIPRRDRGGLLPGV